MDFGTILQEALNEIRKIIILYSHNLKKYDPLVKIQSNLK